MTIKTLLILSILTILFLPLLASAQENLTITTYYPSPNGAFQDMEVRSKLAVGDITDSGNTDLDSLAELGSEQIYANNTIFGTINIIPVCNNNAAGTVLYNPNFKKMQFCNGMIWVNSSEDG